MGKTKLRTCEQVIRCKNKSSQFFSKIATAVNTLKVKWVLNNPKNHQDFGYFYEEICHQEF